MRVPPPPPTRREHLVETLHGVEVADPFRWLEDGRSAETRRWADAQNARTRVVLDALPARGTLHERLTGLLRVPMVTSPRVAGERVFTLERGGERDQAVLVVRGTPEDRSDPGRVLVDPQSLLGDETAALDWYHPSRDGRRVAFGTSVGGDERSVLRVLDVGSGEQLGDEIPHTRAASVAWLPSADAFAYTRYPDPAAVPTDEAGYHRTVWWHRLGDDPGHDELVFDDLPDKTAWPDVSLSRDGRWLLLHVSLGWERSDVHVVDRTTGERRTVIEGVDAVTSLEVVQDHLVGFTNLDARRGRVVAAPLDDPRPARWRTIVGESEAVIEGTATTASSLLVVTTRSAVSSLDRYDLDGGGRSPVALPEPGSLAGLSGSDDRDEAWFSFTSFARPPQLFRWGGAGHEPEPWTELPAAVDPGRYRVEQAGYDSTDGTPITIFLVRSGELDGPRPTVLNGYGGFAVTMGPAYSPAAIAHCDAGGLWAVACIRGGAEEGEDWHRAGMREHKQQVFDDFVAAADWLVAEGWTSTDRLAIRGGSNGGLLVGAALTQQPDRFRAVHCAVPLLDMVRYHRFLIARLWIPEYGDPDEAADFAWLHAYSPYHRVVDGTCYPAVLVTTGEEDSRVDPAHARKMAARLQEATGCGDDHPILLRVESSAGHGQGKPAGRQADELADVMSFLWWQLGVRALG
jgi:prolyl oligopeptidase